MLASLSRWILLILPPICALFAQEGPQSPAPFRSETRLVLVPFNVIRDVYFALDVKADEIVLLEDGKPREFTLFEGPGTGRRLPLELTLLFDTTTLPPPESKIKVMWSHWDRNATYGFTNHWGDKESRAVLEKDRADVRVAVFRYDRQRLQRLCAPTKVPEALTSAIRRLREPIPDGEAIRLSLPSGSWALDRSSQKDRLFWPLSWTMEAATATMNEASAGPNNVVRALVVFSERTGPTTTQPQYVASQANTLGIAIYPVVLNYDEYAQHPFVRAQIGAPNGGDSRIPGGAVAVSNQDYDPNAARQLANYPITGGAGTDRTTGGSLPPEPAASSGAGVQPAQPVSKIVLNWRSARTVAGMDTVAMVRFGSLGELTNGASFYPPKLDAETVYEVLSIIRNEALTRYVIGFAPPSGRERKHTLEIKLKSKATGKLRGGKKTVVY